MKGQLHIIKAFTNSMSANTSLEKVCSELVKKTIEFFGAVDVAVYLYTDKTQELVRTTFTSCEKGTNSVPHPAETLTPGKGFAGGVFKSAKAQFRTVKKRPRNNSPTPSTYISEMAVPISYGEKCIGVICLKKQDSIPFNEDGCLFLSVLCSIASTIIVKTIASTRLQKTEFKLIRTRTYSERDKIRFKEIKGQMEEILYSLSHDFRGPVLTTMSLIDRMATDPKRFAEYHPMLKTSINRLDSILLNIYYYSNNLREPVHANAVIPDRVIREIVVFLKREFKVDFDVRIRSNSEGYIITDEYRFKVMIQSILINAIQYGHKGTAKPVIDIRLHFDSDFCKIIIQDNGPGMPQSMRKKSNAVFNRGNALSKGAGIGIFVCKELARRIGAKVEWISNKDEGTRVEMVVKNGDE